MKKTVIHIVSLLLLTLLVVSCKSDLRHQTTALEKTLHQQERLAMDVTNELSHALQGKSLDSVRIIARQHPQLLFYVFDRHGLVYWSDNWLSMQQFYINTFDRWELYYCENAQVLGRWTRAEDYRIFAVIPLKYNYSFENQQLKNVFIPPFEADKNVEIRRSRSTGGLPVTDADGTYLFTLSIADDDDETPQEETRLADSFSYQPILTQGEHKQRHRLAHRYIVISFAFFIFLVSLGFYGLWRSRGIKNMRLSVKFQYMIVLMLLVTFTYVFLVSLRYVDKRYEERQVTRLLEKARYIQHSLQDLYFWQIDLSPRNSEGLNIDLRDMCFSYETDVHVYDINGNLVGSSSPALFDRNVVSRQMSSEAFFNRQESGVVHERIGDMQYLAAYTEFFNGNYVQIGYIEVPLYVSQDEKHMALDDFLSRLFPPYLLVMIILVLIGLLATRTLTRPLQTLAEGMKGLRVGKRNAHLDYTRSDEVGALVKQYNQMVDELEVSTEKLARSEREGAWRTMARQVAHEINNSLTPMRLNIQQLQRLKSMDQERFDQNFQRITEGLIGQIDSLTRIASSFSSFAKMPEVNTSDVDVAAQLFSVITLFRENESRIPVRYVGAEAGVLARTDGEQIRQVFTNLIKNALQALEGRTDGDIIVVLKDLQDHVEMTFSDNGCGIPEEVRDKIFMPNFTTKSTGTGLGLAISKNIVEGSGGEICFVTSSAGTTFYVTLRK